MNDEREKVSPGLYKHYKGGTYTVLFIAEHHETRAPLVVYVCHETGSLSVRPVRGTSADPDGWLDAVMDFASDPSGTPRFTYIAERPGKLTDQDRLR